MMKSRAAKATFWSTLTILCLFMVGRGIWALQQPWRTTGGKLFAQAFFAALTVFSTYKLLAAVLPFAAGLSDPVIDNLAYGVLLLVFVAGAIFAYLDGPQSPRDLWSTVAGILFLGGGAVISFIRARRLRGERAYGGRPQA